MNCFLSGGAKSGKSALAQQLALQLAQGGTHYYVATMCSTGAEDDARIRRHLADRAGMGFETVECFVDLRDCLDRVDTGAVFLVDSVTALLQNALFPPQKQYEMDLCAAARCADGILAFAGSVRHAVFVSDCIYCDAERYSETTECYRRCLADIDRRLAAFCDTVIEVAGGQPVFYRGGWPI